MGLLREDPLGLGYIMRARNEGGLSLDIKIPRNDIISIFESNNRGCGLDGLNRLLYRVSSECLNAGQTYYNKMPSAMPAIDNSKLEVANNEIEKLKKELSKYKDKKETKSKSILAHFLNIARNRKK